MLWQISVHVGLVCVHAFTHTEARIENRQRDFQKRL